MMFQVKVKKFNFILVSYMIFLTCEVIQQLHVVQDMTCKVGDQIMITIHLKDKIELISYVVYSTHDNLQNRLVHSINGQLLYVAIQIDHF